MKMKICPLMKIAEEIRNTREDVEALDEIYCFEKDCGIWDKIANRCGFIANPSFGPHITEIPERNAADANENTPSQRKETVEKV